MANCIECLSEYPDARADLGFKTCLVCGEQHARVEKAHKARCVAPAFNKGPMTYIATLEQAKDIGR